MRLMLLTFKKDVRRWWPAVVVTWVMLAVLARTDRWRADWLVSPMESWMNMLLTLAWALVIALAVLEEPLVGDGNFWTTRPHPWPPLLTAKLLFAVLAIHVPLFVADLYIVGARGLSPLEALSELLWKQVLFFGALTLPSIALATLVRNFTHFVIAAFGLVAVLAVLNGGFQSLPGYSLQEHVLRNAMVRLILAAAALGIIGIQYARRRVLPAQVMAVIAALTAVAISTWLPARAEYAFSGTSTHPRLTLRDLTPADESFRRRMSGKDSFVLLPIAINAGSSNDRVHVSMVQLEIVTPGGERIRSGRVTAERPFDKIDLMTYPYATVRDGTPEWLELHFSRPVWERVRHARAHIRGWATLQFYHPGQTVVLPVDGHADVPDLGRCTSALVDDHFSAPLLKVLCESPREIPAASLNLRHDASGRELRDRLNSSMRITLGPHEAWLSPLHRGQTYFRLTDQVVLMPGGQWMFPLSYVAASHVSITPEVVTGKALVDFDFGEADLTAWRIGR